jgi:hypothetical protein
MREYYGIKLIFFNTKKAAMGFVDVVGGCMQVGSDDTFLKKSFGDCVQKKRLVVGRFSTYEMDSYKELFGIEKKKANGKIYYEQVVV